jgi:hypothetical protein
MVSDEPSELAPPSFKPSNISPTRLDSLVCLVITIYDAYANENTYFDRIALVGCDTSRIRQGLTRNFAKMIYDNIPALKTAEIIKTNNNTTLRVFISEGLGGFDGDFAVAVLNDNVALIVAEIFF